MKPIFHLFLLIFVVLLGLCESFCQDSLCAILPKDSIYDKYNNAHTGLYAPNFSFITDKDTTKQYLYNLQADTIIILFYDPDCYHCKKEIKRLKKDKRLKKSLQSQKTIFLTIPPDIDYDYWHKSNHIIPDKWINAYTTDKDILISKYLWKVPQMFVLDNKKKIIRIEMYREDLEQ